MTTEPAVVYRDYRSFVLTGQPGDTFVKPDNPYRTGAENAKSISTYVMLPWPSDLPTSNPHEDATNKVVNVEEITSTFGQMLNRVLTGNRAMQYRTKHNRHLMQYTDGTISEHGGDYNNLLGLSQVPALATTPAAASGRFSRKTLAEHHARAVSDRLAVIAAELEEQVSS